MLTTGASKKVLLLELTVPWEDCMEEANEHKQLKYQEFKPEEGLGGIP